MDPMQNDESEQKQGLEQQLADLRKELAALQQAASERAQQAYEVVKEHPGTSIVIASLLAGVIGFILGQQAEAERHRHRWPWR